MNSLEMGNPWVLLLLPLAVLFWLLARHSSAALSPTRRKTALILRVAIFVCLCLALADIRWFGPSRETHILWLVDASRSLQGRGLEVAADLAEKIKPLPHNVSQSWIAFGGDALPLDKPPSKDIVIDDTRTNLAQALQFSEASFPDGKNKVLVLLSDGVETQGRMLDQASSLRRSGITTHVVPLSPPDSPEALVTSISAPSEVAEGEPFKLRATIQTNRAMEADIDIFQNGLKVASRREKLSLGQTTFEATQTLPPGKVTDISLSVRPQQDSLADNNTASLTVRSKGRGKVLLLTDQPDSARHLAQALKSENLSLEVRPEAGIPSTQSELQNYDALILDNIPASSFTPAQFDLLVAYTREFGGGLLMLGGENAFGLGGFQGTPLEELLPVRSNFEKEQETPSLAIVTVIDRSGSMAGEKLDMAKTAAEGAVQILSPRDYAGVIGFDNSAFWIADLQGAANGTAIRERIGTLQSGGGTNLTPALELALTALRSSPAKIKHVILLTDGASIPGPFEELTAQMAAEKITVSTVAVGTDADVGLLEQIARLGNGRHYYTDNPRAIPQIFARETMMASKSAIEEIPFRAVPTKPADFLEGIDWTTAPLLLGYVKTEAKPTADLWLATENGLPLLASWQTGLGRVAAFTSDTRQRWAGEWLSWQGFGPYWVQVLRHIMRPETLSRLSTSIVPVGREAVIQVNATDAAGRFLDAPNGRIALASPDGSTAEIPLVQTAPGLLEAKFPTPLPGSYHLQITVESGDQVISSQYESLTIGYPDEYRLLPADESSLAQLADETGGKVNPSREEILAPPAVVQTTEYELWPWLALAALLIFLADVAQRRLRFPAASAE